MPTAVASASAGASGDTSTGPAGEASAAEKARDDAGVAALELKNAKETAGLEAETMQIEEFDIGGVPLYNADLDVDGLRYFRTMTGRIAGVPVDVSRTGYTGDLGYEIWVRTDAGRLRFDGLLLRVPIFGVLVRDIALSRFCRTYATLIRSGVPILRTLEIVSSASGKVQIEEKPNA